MATEDGGFYFHFDGDLPVVGEPSPSTNGAITWPNPTISTQSFPWVSLHSKEIKEWEANYPGCATSPTTSTTETRKMTLCVPSPASSAVVFQLFYQTPPKTDLIPLFQSEEGNQIHQMCGEASSDVYQRDIIPGQYYGGLKVWSCAPLLARYLLQHEDVYRPLFASSSSEGQSILASSGREKQHEETKKLLVAEVGCGHALPGLAAICLGASRVLLHDFNKEVLETCTGPNVAATIRANQDFVHPSVQVKLVHGDWVNLRLNDGDEASFCDILLGSDVTFDKEACDKLTCLLHRWLTPVSGFAIIASKEYYFGTNGGRLELIESASQYHLRVETLKYFKDGGAMDRVILKISYSS